MQRLSVFSQLFQRAKSVFLPSKEVKILRSFKSTVDAINSIESRMQSLTNDKLKAKTLEFQQRLSNGESLEELLIEAFAVVREAAVRVLGMRLFDVQLMGAMALHKGMVAEMKTGEGKTLMATAAIYLNALEKKGAHVVTVNDYLAKRDAATMSPLYNFLDLTVGCITHDLSDYERKEAYRADITYGTNNEIGFDYLRDNMKFALEDMCLRPFHYAIVDEVDSILIDEARTPLIISGPAHDSSELYQRVNRWMINLPADHYEKNNKTRNITFTDLGYAYIEEKARAEGLLHEEHLFHTKHTKLVHHVQQALKAHHMFARDVDYIVEKDNVIIIDEFTGRKMEGRRYSDGLHQALEAKENVTIQRENQTLASITFQNLFRLYGKLSGMTGTAATERLEFEHTYGLSVLSIPTHQPIKRLDEHDQIYRTFKEKMQALSAYIAEHHQKRQPILVGTVSIEKSEIIAQLLQNIGIPHRVLNARQHEREAEIIAQAGAPGAVTIATNMAGRGTDIQLGGNIHNALHDLALLRDENNMSAEDFESAKKHLEENLARAKAEAIKAGGLLVIGTERHENRRIDNQLRGRSGRQGDPGKSIFFLSLEDDLMRVFGSGKLDGLLQRLGLKPNEAITHPWISRAIEKAQERVERHHYDSRKHVLKYDNVMNEQRKVIYHQRNELLRGDSVHEDIRAMRERLCAYVIEAATQDRHVSEWSYSTLHEELQRLFDINVHIAEEERGSFSLQQLTSKIHALIEDKWRHHEARFEPEVFERYARHIILRHLDEAWKEHLHILDNVRQGIHLLAYGQKDPLNEYKQQAFHLFQEMMHKIDAASIAFLSRLDLSSHERDEDTQYVPLHEEDDADTFFESLDASNLERINTSAVTHSHDDDEMHSVQPVSTHKRYERQAESNSTVSLADILLLKKKKEVAQGSEKTEEKKDINDDTTVQASAKERDVVRRTEIEKSVQKPIISKERDAKLPAEQSGGVHMHKGALRRRAASKAELGANTPVTPHHKKPQNTVTKSFQDKALHAHNRSSHPYAEKNTTQGQKPRAEKNTPLYSHDPSTGNFSKEITSKE